MADSEFEEFRHYFERVPQHIKATAATYRLVHVGLDELVSPSNPRPKDIADSDVPEVAVDRRAPAPPLGSIVTGSNGSSGSTGSSESTDSLPSNEMTTRSGRRRRRLPDLPQGAKEAMAVATAAASTGLSYQGETSLAAELGAAGGVDLVLGPTRPLFLLKCSGFEGEASPDSSTSCADIDSGHSTLHSPQLHNGSMSLSPVSGSPPASPPQLELMEATHRGLHKFVPRHRDELEVEIGDPIYVQKEADDLWCEGVNLRSGRSGSFPSAYAVDLEYSDFDPGVTRVRRERFLLRYLGSVETAQHKGTGVLAAAVRKVAQPGPDGLPKHQSSSLACVLEVSDQGLRMVDRGRPKRLGPALDYFYSLKHVSFCAFHPRDHRYLGFITKHPTLQRFACHVFFGQESTRPVAESIGRAFQRFYQKFIETAYPIEDIYIE